MKKATIGGFKEKKSKNSELYFYFVFSENGVGGFVNQKIKNDGLSSKLIQTRKRTTIASARLF